MKKKDKAKLHTRLKLIKKYLATDPSKLNYYFGICHNIGYVKKPYFHVSIVTLLLYYPNCHKNALGNNDVTFPVDGQNRYYAQTGKKAMWANPKRLALLDWLIEETKP